MPRTSAAEHATSNEIAVINRQSYVESLERPQPPDDLGGEECLEWRATVDRLPADWFPRETFPLLAQYCKHVVQAKRIGQMLASLHDRPPEEFDVVVYDKLLKMQVRESKMIASLSVKMRLSHSATMRQETTRKQPVAKYDKPWKS